MVFDKHPEYKKKGGGRHLWATGYYVVLGITMDGHKDIHGHLERSA